MAPVKETLIGMVDNLGDAGVQKWRDTLEELGTVGE